MVPTRTGLLLEHFARLAASAAAAPIAAVGVRGHRGEIGASVAVFGLSDELTPAFVAVDAALASGSGLTMIADPCSDGRLQSLLPGTGPVQPGFLAHLKLHSAGGERIGFICVLDSGQRRELTTAQVAALDDIASMIVADRRREQRHLHFVHVADRALRVDRMLRLVSDAASCADALTGVLEELCRFHGAEVGRIWQSSRTVKAVQEISRYDVTGSAEVSDAAADPLNLVSAVTVASVRRNEPHTVRFSELDPAERPPAAVMAGLSSEVCIPIWVQQQRFAILLGFAGEPDNLDSVVGDIASLANAIRPALFRKVTEERIRFVAHHDNLTQLPNRMTFRERLDRAFAAARLHEEQFAVLYLDLDGFKLVNDRHGHDTGDKLLAAVAQRLRDNMREGDTVARLGGDEFAIIQPSGSQPLAAIALAGRLLDTLGEPFALNGQHSVVGISIGIAVYPQDGETADVLLRNADAALYRAKEAGRNNYQLFDPAIRTHQQERFLIEQDLRDATEARELTLVYQPVCDSATLEILGFEALLRWNHRLRGPIQPSRFIPLAESSGLILPLGGWALKTACADAASWEEPTYVSVNLSPLQFRQPDFPEQVAAVLRQSGLPAERLELEVTEGLLLDDSDLVLRTTRQLRDLGVRITLDDFGTAYASLSYLRRFPFDRIKIDKSFIRGIGDDHSTQAIVEAVLSLGKRLELTVVAEGVETERELAVLRGLGCSLVQGFLSGRPVPGRRVRSLLRAQRKRAAALVPHAGTAPADSGWQGPRDGLGVAPEPAGPIPYEQCGGGE